MANASPNAASSEHVEGVISLAFIGLLGAVLYFCYKRKLTPNFFHQRTSKQNNDSSLSEKIRLRQLFQFEELNKATENFSDQCLLGSGAIGNVYKATFEEEGTLAIKRAHADSYQIVELLSRVKHRNIVGLVGYCEEDGKRVRTLTWRRSVNIAIGAAKEPCNMEMMLKMAKLGLRCAVKVPKQRPKMAQSSLSIDRIGLQRFHIEMDSLGFQSTSLRCLETGSIIIEIDKNNLRGITKEEVKNKNQASGAINSGLAYCVLHSIMTKCETRSGILAKVDLPKLKN
ncbi:hypothetical protein RJ641_010849 [Dillenia turbinata]|uniref:non-specific serine/threonine protein kinase n=1 Tax=Dillenia turbinata TaxID=194707 RepID=A0AAN8Z4P0_9MAGN